MQNLGAKLPSTLNITETVTVVRSPYCVSGDEFKAIAAVADGRFACGKCGHLAIPSDKTFRCACQKCFELRLLDTRRCG
jgi:hypothetical protein